MKKSEETVTIAEEIEMVDSYIYILNVRFAGDIHYEKYIDRSLLSVEMPGMILRPLWRTVSTMESVRWGMQESSAFPFLEKEIRSASV